MVDQSVALQVQPLDVATPLYKAAMIHQAAISSQQEQFKLQQAELGAAARGLTPYANSPEFPQKWAETVDNLHQKGILDEQTHKQWRNNPSQLALKSIISQTQAEGAPTDAMRNLQAAGIDPTSAEGKSAMFPKSEIDKPIAVPAGSALVNPKTKEVLYQNKSALFNSQTLDDMADQYLAGDKSVFQNLGRGAQGSENIASLRQRVSERARATGLSPQDVAVKLAEFDGLKAGERTLGTRSANLGMAANAVNNIAPIALASSEKVDRTQFPDLNAILLAAEKGIGDENIVTFGINVNTLINLYAKAQNPNGIPTDADKSNARANLSTAWSKGQFAAAVKQMQIDIAAEKKAPGQTQQDLRDLHGGKQQQNTQQKGQSNQSGDPIAEAKAAIGRGAPREAVIKRLKEKGIDPSPLLQTNDPNVI